jgi:hypothetical protein
MPFNPHALFGPLVAGDLDEYNDSGAVNKSFEFTSRVETVEKRRHSPSIAGTALTSVTCANTGDTFTKSSHGLVTGQAVTVADFSAGIAAGTYYAIRVDANTFKLASSPTNAYAGTAVAVSADGTGGVVTPITLASYRQIGQVQVFYLGAQGTQKIEPIPTAAGAFTGLALVGPGEHLALANFQADAEIHRMNNDATKLLMVTEVKQARSVENPADIDISWTYFPKIAAPV